VTNFSDLGLIQPLLKVLAAENYTTPTPIQLQAIQPVLQGRDLVGIAQTGTGKTAAFALPILQRLDAAREKLEPKSCRVLLLAPTRELAAQISDSFAVYGRNLRFRQAVVFGGVSIGAQIRAMSGGVDILIATPGRLLDLIGQRAVHLNGLRILVLDEADHMLDLGFIVPIRKIMKLLPKQRQNLFFSATMPEAIAGLAKDLLTDPVQVSVTPVAKTADKIDQKVIMVPQANKGQLLAALTRELNMERGLVFSRTKHGADKIVRQLEQAGIHSAAIHGNKSQNQRVRVLDQFKDGKLKLLIATDIAARGIDVDGLSHVVNFDLPDVPETYVHRIGRTARAGATGIAISFCANDERGNLKQIERLIRKPIVVMEHALGGVDKNEPGRVERQQRHHQSQGARKFGHGKPAQGKSHGRPGGKPSYRKPDQTRREAVAH